MTEYKDNETVTLSLERYEELKQTEKKYKDLFPPFMATAMFFDPPPYKMVEAYRKYFEDNKLTMIYTAETVRVMTIEEAQKLTEKTTSKYFQ